MSSNAIKNAKFSGGYDLGLIIRAEVRDGMSKHALTILDFPLPKGRFKKIPPEKTPVTFRWGMGISSLRTFVGYVNHHEIVDQRGTQVVRLFLIGSSLPMDDPRPRTWGRVSGSYVVKTIAADHNMRCITHKSPEVIPSWGQGNESDFQMLRRLEDRTGYRFWFDGTTIYFLDPNRLVISPNLSSVTRLFQNQSGRNNLFALNVLSGSLTPESNNPTVKSVYGLDQNGRLIKSTSARAIADGNLDTPGRTSISSLSANSMREARSMSNTEIGKSDWMEAEAVIAGNSGIKVGSVVSLDGDLLASGNRGLWLVKDTVNIIDRTLSTTLYITRNTKTGLKYSTNSSLNEPSGSDSVLRKGGAWEARSLGTTYV